MHTEHVSAGYVYVVSQLCSAGAGAEIGKVPACHGLSHLPSILQHIIYK